jgi:hypothetical protein
MLSNPAPRANFRPRIDRRATVKADPCGTGTSTAFRTVTSTPLVTVQKCEKPLQRSDCDVVTFQNGGGGPEGHSTPYNISRNPEDWRPPDFDQDAFEERAAVLEYDAGLTRAEAEAQARAELVTEAGPDDELSDLDF